LSAAIVPASSTCINRGHHLDLALKSLRIGLGNVLFAHRYSNPCYAYRRRPMRTANCRLEGLRARPSPNRLERDRHSRPYPPSARHLSLEEHYRFDLHTLR
jgi:hypothetical protein